MTRMDDLALRTPLKGNLVLCQECGEESLHRIGDLYKFVWVRSGEARLRVDHIPLALHADQLVPLSPFHRLEILQIRGEIAILAFDSNFYCIFGHDGEVSCSGLLFNGTSEVLRLELSAERAGALQRVIDDLRAEYEVADDLREEMLRMQLKRFIILCTRFARERFAVSDDRERRFDIVRRYYVLVDEHFRTRKQVQDYADLLHRSPKTLANLFAAYGQPSPLAIIRDRVNAEARRLLLYTAKSAKEIAFLLGFEETAAFSRFFTRMNGESITAFRRREKRE